MNFKKIAQDTTLLCPIMRDRIKLETEQVIDRELTVIGFDFAPKFDKEGNRMVNPSTGEIETFGVVIFQEEPEKYYCVGAVFTNVCHAWASEFDSPEEASIELARAGGVKVRFTQSKTKKGNNLIAVEILN